MITHTKIRKDLKFRLKGKVLSGIEKQAAAIETG